MLYLGCNNDKIKKPSQQEKANVLRPLTPPEKFDKTSDGIQMKVMMKTPHNSSAVDSFVQKVTEQGYQPTESDFLKLAKASKNAFVEKEHYRKLSEDVMERNDTIKQERASQSKKQLGKGEILLGKEKLKEREDDKRFAERTKAEKALKKYEARLIKLTIQEDSKRRSTGSYGLWR